MVKRSKQEQSSSLSYKDLFIIFLRAGMAFGGGAGILAVLERELVAKRQAITRKEFLTLWSLGRIVPSGTMTALAVAFGYRYKKLLGTVVTLVALVLPAFIITIILTIFYSYLKHSPYFSLLSYSVLPAAVGLIVFAAVSLGKDVFRPSRELLLALIAFIGDYFFHINTALLLVGGGFVGIILLSKNTQEKNT